LNKHLRYQANQDVVTQLITIREVLQFRQQSRSQRHNKPEILG